MTARDRERLARAALAHLAEPGDPVMGALLATRPPETVLADLLAGRAEDVLKGWSSGSAGQAELARLAILSPAVASAACRRITRWSSRLGRVPAEGALGAWRRAGMRFLIPGDPEWPSQLEVLGECAPWGLWVRGNGDLRFACLRSVAVVGTRAASAYGAHVSGELAAGLAERGWTVVSGGAYGIDERAHRGALAAGGVTVVVLACGADVAYPRCHQDLFRMAAADGVIVTESPPGQTPTRPAFLTRNRLIAALSRGTVVVEAASRSGALSTARHARDQGRPLMAVPGPVTSGTSAGCHALLRDWDAICVTGAADVAGTLEPGTEPIPGPARAAAPVVARDVLSDDARAVLEAVPARRGWGPARIAVTAGVDFDTVLRCLGELAAGGFVERREWGWRARRPGG